MLYLLWFMKKVPYQARNIFCLRAYLLQECYTTPSAIGGGVSPVTSPHCELSPEVLISYTRGFFKASLFYVTQLEFQPLFELLDIMFSHQDSSWCLLPYTSFPTELPKGSLRHLQERHKATAILNEFRCLRLFQLQSQQHTFKVFPECLRTPRVWRAECVSH